MALPDNVGSGTVTGRLIDSLGNPIEGKVTFTPSPAYLLNASAEPSPVTIIPKPVTVTLADGAFTTTLTATDDPDNNPTSWTYKVAFNLTGAKRASFDIQVPEGETVDLTTVAPVGSSGGVIITRGPDGIGVPAGGSSGQVLAKASSADYDTHWVTSSGGGGGEGGPVYWDDVLSKPSTFPPSTHNHDDRYFTETESDARFVRTVNGSGPDGNGNVVVATDVGSVEWDAIEDKPSTFTPSSHTHAIADVTGLQSALNGKAGTGDLFSGSYDDLTDKPDIPDSAADVNAVPTTRTVNGHALSSNVTLSASDVDARSSSWTPSVSDIPAGSTLSVVFNGSWPARPTNRTDVVVQWLDFTGTAGAPSAGLENVDIVIQDSSA